jgi:hypothetical protein
LIKIRKSFIKRKKKKPEAISLFFSAYAAESGTERIGAEPGASVAIELGTN